MKFNTAAQVLQRARQGQDKCAPGRSVGCDVLEAANLIRLVEAVTIVTSSSSTRMPHTNAGCKAICLRSASWSMRRLGSRGRKQIESCTGGWP
ncbi:MAG: hypothetical protein ACREBC_24505, partial [Pyrinomonadaceae bacterium]